MLDNSLSWLHSVVDFEYLPYSCKSLPIYFSTRQAYCSIGRYSWTTWLAIIYLCPRGISMPWSGGPVALLFFILMSSNLRFLDSTHKAFISVNISTLPFNLNEMFTRGPWILRHNTNWKRGRRKPKLTCEETVKGDLKGWNASKDLALNRSKWKTTIHMLNFD
jgi:hypothetical protein